MFSKESKVPLVFEMLQYFPYFTVLEPVFTISQLRYYCTICVPHGEFTIPMCVCVFPALFPLSSRRCSFQCPAYRQTSHFQLFACLMQVQGFLYFFPSPPTSKQNKNKQKTSIPNTIYNPACHLHIPFLHDYRAFKIYAILC